MTWMGDDRTQLAVFETLHDCPDLRCHELQDQQVHLATRQACS